LSAVAAYNRELTAFTREQGEAVIRGLMADPLGERTRDPLVQQDAGVRRLLGLFAAADLLAVRNQRSDNKLVFAVALLLFLAMLAFNFSVWKWSMLFYALFLLAIALVAKWARRRRIEERFFDYRALAEGLRVAVFWRLAGLPRRVSHNYLNEHLGVMSWIREGLVGAELASLTTESAELAPTAARVAFVREVWLEDQGNYFDRKVTRLGRQTRMLSRYATAAFFISWTVAVGKLIGKAGGPGSWLESLTTQLVMLSGPFLAAGIALGFYRQKRALDTVLRRYAMSRELFDRAVARLQTGDYPAETVLHQLGREALSENADWLWTQRDAPLKPRK
jgi:Ca2+/Na+ antiporter